ncbi:MAG: VOC family protein [Alphaproteobacteria bacterium]|nr:VOC family protein [Alphaproteobacteria bacterium]
MNALDRTQSTRCSFCRSGIGEIRSLVVSGLPPVFICDGCIRLCSDVLDHEMGEGAVPAGVKALGPLLAIDHVQLAMPAGREDEARAFYGALLGLTEVEKPPALARRGGCWFERPGIRVHLGVEADFRAARKAHVAFLVADYEGLRAAIADAGFEVVGDDALEGTQRFFAFDPFGNRLEFIRGERG